jgi:predicted nucleic acid-binding protein
VSDDGPVLIDSDVLSDLARGHPGVTASARAYLLSHGRLTISAVTVFERLRGYRLALRRGKPFQGQLRQFEALTASSVVLPFDVSAAEVAAVIWAALPTKRDALLGDILIAATAVAHHLSLVTANRVDFEVIAKATPLPLTIVDWRR